jgi:hyperosmotically inducible protein
MKTKNTHNLISPSGKTIGFALLFSVLGLTGCQPEGAAEKAGQKIDLAVKDAGKTVDDSKAFLSEKAETTNSYMDDSVITTEIKVEILKDPLLKVSQINIRTAGGRVMLSGFVDSAQSINRAIEIAHSNQNVKSVESTLAIKSLK